uniref:Uncharacterized protein n=1 Tax=Parascaris equorum TaxID=6256 RepID=A0A914RQ01_PAREQ
MFFAEESVQVVERLAAPYGDCETRKKMNSSWYIYDDYDYNAEFLLHMFLPTFSKAVGSICTEKGITANCNSTDLHSIVPSDKSYDITAALSATTPLLMCGYRIFFASKCIWLYNYSFPIRRIRNVTVTGVHGCHRSCFQNALLAKCACGDPRFPVPRGRKHCAAFNATARACLERAILEIGDFHHITDLDDCVCKQPCEHETFSVTFSASKWPSGATDLGDCEGMTEGQCEAYYSKNAAMVEVYYEQLNYELLKESEAYGL